jgi:hypothetical protein
MAGFGGHLFNLTRLFAGPPSVRVSSYSKVDAVEQMHVNINMAIQERGVRRT